MNDESIALALHPNGCAIVDVDFCESIGRKFNWRLDDKTAYRPRAFISMRNGKKRRQIYLERFIAKVTKGKFVLFLNGNTLDCRKSNLLIVDSRQAIFHFDFCQRHEWELEESITNRINPQRRREDSWRMWCEGKEPNEIAEQLVVGLNEVKCDILAMADDPLAAEWMN